MEIKVVASRVVHTMLPARQQPPPLHPQISGMESSSPKKLSSLVNYKVSIGSATVLKLRKFVCFQTERWLHLPLKRKKNQLIGIRNFFKYWSSHENVNYAAFFFCILTSNNRWSLNLPNDIVCLIFFNIQYDAVVGFNLNLNVFIANWKIAITIFNSQESQYLKDM